MGFQKRATRSAALDDELPVPPQVVSMLITGRGDGPFQLIVEPEANTFDFPPEREVMVTFRGSVSMIFEIEHGVDYLQVWLPRGATVWAKPAGGPERQIGGWVPFPTSPCPTARTWWSMALSR
jgi:hypothetical protein